MVIPASSLLRRFDDGVGDSPTYIRPIHPQAVAVLSLGGVGLNLAVTLLSFFLNPYRKLTVIIGRTLVVTLLLFLVVTLWLFLPW